MKTCALHGQIFFLIAFYLLPVSVRTRESCHVLFLVEKSDLVNDCCPGKRQIY